MNHYKFATILEHINLEVGGFLGAFIAAIGLYVGMKRKSPSQTVHARSFSDSHKVQRILNQIILSIPEAKIASVGLVTDGGKHMDLTKPKELQILSSSDFPTWEQFNIPIQMEPELMAAHSNMIDRGGIYDFKATQLQSQATLNWYKDNHLTQTSVHLVGIDRNESYSIVVYVNYTKEFIPYQESNSILRSSIVSLREIYEKPFKKRWWSKKKIVY